MWFRTNIRRVFPHQRRCTYEGKRQCHGGSTADDWPHAKRAGAECSLYPTPRFVCFVPADLSQHHSTESSTANLQSTSQAHDVLNLFIGTSKQLVTALENTDWLDRVLIISAFVFFGLVVLFVLKQRILDRGLRIAFWWTRFVPGLGSPSSRVTGQMLKEVVADGHAETSLTSIVVTATAVPSTLASALAVTATLIGPTEDAFHVAESVLSPSVVTEPASASDPGRSPFISDPAHVEL